MAKEKKCNTDRKEDRVQCSLAPAKTSQEQKTERQNPGDCRFSVKYRLIDLKRMVGGDAIKERCE